MSGSSDSGTDESDLTISACASNHQIGTDDEVDDVLSDNSSSCDEEEDPEHYDEDEGEGDEDGEEYDYDEDANGNYVDEEDWENSDKRAVEAVV